MDLKHPPFSPCGNCWHHWILLHLGGTLQRSEALALLHRSCSHQAYHPSKRPTSTLSKSRHLHLPFFHIFSHLYLGIDAPISRVFPSPAALGRSGEAWRIASNLLSRLSCTTQPDTVLMLSGRHLRDFRGFQALLLDRARRDSRCRVYCFCEYTRTHTKMYAYMFTYRL